MSVRSRVANLKNQLEQLFPGKWITAVERSCHLKTGIAEIDQSITRGITRRRITEWNGALSSGKTTLLRSAVTNWCADNLNVAYIDAEGKLLAADWAFVQGQQGKFWIVRPGVVQTPAIIDGESTILPMVSKRTLYMQEALWSADQFIRSNAFDVVILDLAGIEQRKNIRGEVQRQSFSSRIYARLQRALDKSNTALIVVRDGKPVDSPEDGNGWGCHARFSFDWGMTIACEAGLAGVAMITPSVKCNVSKNGLSQVLEVNLGCSVQNRLFTHPQVPDRRTSKR